MNKWLAIAGMIGAFVLMVALMLVGVPSSYAMSLFFFLLAVFSDSPNRYVFFIVSAAFLVVGLVFRGFPL